MIKIGFIFPSSDYLFDPFRGDPHTHLQILTVLDDRLKEKVDCKLIDLRGVDRKFAKYCIPECDLYLHSVYTLDWDEQISMVKELRERYPKAKHIAGGPHAVVFQKESLDIFDSLIFGDGEESIIKLVNDFEKGELKKIYKQENPIDINNYPHPRRHYQPGSAVSRKGLINLRNQKGFDQLMSTTVVFSRGCPYNCAFCAMPQIKGFNPGIRFRKPEFIEEEIEYLKKEFGIEAISLLDEICVPYDKEHAIAHLKAIGRTGIVWKGQCRVDGVTPEIARLMKGSGCAIMCLGIESAYQDCLDLINKKTSVEKAKQSIKYLKENGIEVRLYMILGLPGEDEDIVEKTWEFIKETNPSSVYLSLLTIRPGTIMYDNPKKFGFKWVSEDWSKTMHMYSRYDDEMPELTFEYEENTPWGKSLSNEQIVKNYLELQKRIKENNYGPL